MFLIIGLMIYRKGRHSQCFYRHQRVLDRHHSRRELKAHAVLFA